LIQGIVFGLAGGILYFPLLFWVRPTLCILTDDSCMNGLMNDEVLQEVLFLPEAGLVVFSSR
jgi:hypothetical protein